MSGRITKVEEEVSRIRTARWKFFDSHLWIWIEDPGIIEDRSDYYPVLRQWIEGFICEYPYILHDDDSDSWAQSTARTYQGPIIAVKGKPYRQVLFGCMDLQVLRSHQEEYGLRWVGGLSVYIFERPEEVAAQLRAWDGQDEAALASFLKPPLVSLTTGGDAQGLYVDLGLWSLEEFLEKASQVAAALGFDWGPFDNDDTSQKRSVRNGGSDREGVRLGIELGRALVTWFAGLWTRRR